MTKIENAMKRHRLLILIVGGMLIILLLTAGWALFDLGTRSDDLQGLGAWPTATPSQATAVPPKTVAISWELENAGLKDGPYLDATGVSGHLARLRNGEVDQLALESYARDLQTLNERTAEWGAPIPASFWDVRDSNMEEGNVTEYKLVNALAQPELESYVGLMAQSYERFKIFKENEVQGADDSALDAALDILHLTIDYIEVAVGPLPEDASEEEKLVRAQNAMRTWQALIAGTTRYNPLTSGAMVAETLSSRETVMAMWRHETGEQAGNSEIWGVSGFAPRFVGNEANINQVEHMSISMFIQLVDQEPVAVLNLQEDKELLTGHSNSEEMANADKALNEAVATQFVPDFAHDMRGTVEQLRCYLKGLCS
ncbi:MAG: hypothetical protein ACK2U4_15795 [Candidatus Promineifilaceae bacterium]